MLSTLPSLLIRKAFPICLGGSTILILKICGKAEGKCAVCLIERFRPNTFAAHSACNRCTPRRRQKRFCLLKCHTINLLLKESISQSLLVVHVMVEMLHPGRLKAGPSDS